jgi:hypothetical protein
MKTITRSIAVFTLLIGLAVVVQAQNPAVRMKAGPPPELISYTLQNLGGATISVGIVELRVFDAKTCKLLCATRNPLNKKILPCKTLDGQIRCAQPLPQASGYIYWLRIRNSGGTLLTENWLYVP